MNPQIGDPQLSCLPFDSPGNVENHLAQIVVSLQRLAPVLTAQECVWLLEELALVRTRLESIERGARERIAQQAKAVGLSA